MGSILFLMELCVSVFDCRGVRRNRNPHWKWYKSRDRIPAWEGRRLELREWPVPPLPNKFCSAICRSKLSSQNPFELRVF